eukprot:354698-Chlamydomonas_euryale.AAC.6
MQARGCQSGAAGAFPHVPVSAEAPSTQAVTCRPGPQCQCCKGWCPRSTCWVSAGAPNITAATCRPLRRCQCCKCRLKHI